MAFDPEAYIAEKASATTPFDPASYIDQKVGASSDASGTQSSLSPGLQKVADELKLQKAMDFLRMKTISPGGPSFPTSQYRSSSNMSDFEKNNPNAYEINHLGSLGIDIGEGIIGKTPLLSGLSLSAGENLRNALNSATGSPDTRNLTAQQTMNESVKNLLLGAAIGKGGELIGRGVTAAVKGAANLPSKLLGVLRTPEQKAAAAEAQALSSKFDVPLTAADITASKPIAQIEKTLQAIPFSGGAMQEAQQTQYNKLVDAVDSITQKYPAMKDPSVFGQTIQDAAQKGRDLFKQEASTYFNAVADKIPQGGSGVKLSNTQTDALDFLSKEQDLLGGFKNSELLKKVSSLSGMDKISGSTIQTIMSQGSPSIKGQILKEAVPSVSWDSAQIMRGKLGDLIGKVGADTQEGRAYTILKNGIDKDMAQFAGQHPGDIKDAYDLANAYYQSGKEIFNDPKLVGLLKARPENAANLLVAGNNKSTVDLVRQAVGDKSFKDVQAAYLDKIFFPSNAAEFSPAKFVTSLSKFEPETLQAVLGAKQAANLQDLAKLSSITRGADKIAGNTSGTGQAVIGAKSLTAPFTAMGAGIASGHPILGALTAVGTILGPTMAAKAYLSPAVTSMIAQGVKLPAKSPEAIAMASKIIAYLTEEPQKIGDNLLKADSQISRP